MDKYDNLRNKTIFDICDNKEILKRIYTSIKSEYMERLNFLVQHGENKVMYRVKAEDFMELADITNDKQLRQAVKKYYPSEVRSINEMFNE